jgi:hypothetical protein
VVKDQKEAADPAPPIAQTDEKEKNPRKEDKTIKTIDVEIAESDPDSQDWPTGASAETLLGDDTAPSGKSTPISINNRLNQTAELN